MPEDPLTLAVFARRQEVLIGLVADGNDMLAKLIESLQWITTAAPPHGPKMPKVLGE